MLEEALLRVLRLNAKGAGTKKTARSSEDFEDLNAPAQRKFSHADGNLWSLWHTSWNGGDVGKPATMVFEEATEIQELHIILPRGQDQ